MKPYYEDDAVKIFLGDCRDILPSLEPVDLVIADPPYGSGLSTDFNDRSSSKASSWWRNTDRSACKRYDPVVGNDQPFDPTHLLEYDAHVLLILWGANWYASRLPDSGGWFVWDKRRGVEDAEWPMSDGELAWTNIRNALRIFRHRWFGLLRDSEKGERWHPTQKPVALMRWCILQTPDTVQTILDPYMGSGPVLRAAKDLGRKAIGIEIEEKYCEIAAKRMSQSVMDLSIPS